LVNQLLDHQYRFYISRLSKTYSAIPIANISNNLGGTVEELTDYLEVLIKQGHLNAQIERPDKSGLGVVLRFYLDPSQGPQAKTEKQQQQGLFEQTQRTNTLAEQVKSADYRLSLTKEYVDHLKRLNKKAANGGEAMDTSWDDGVVDEDLMAV
jgi:COP9 signalosome complex subunit 3